MSRLEDAEVFVAVVDAGGSTAAATALDLSQPAVSRRIAALEARLGVRLLTRSTRRLRPTDAGASFYERARRALGELAEGECEAAAANAELRGTLRITAPPAFGRHVVARRRADVAAVQVVGPLRTNDVEALAAAARAGMGIARLPAFLVADELARGTLQPVLPRIAARRVDVFAVYRERRHLPARTRAVLDFRAARLRTRRR